MVGGDWIGREEWKRVVEVDDGVDMLYGRGGSCRRGLDWGGWIPLYGIGCEIIYEARLPIF